MARHRNVRNVKYDDEYDGFDDVYGHSVEDDYCVSPATAAQFLYDRTQSQQLASFMAGREIPEEDENEVDSEGEGTRDPLQDSSNYTRPKLNALDEAKLNTCLEEMRSILGDSSERALVEAAMLADYVPEKALNLVLNKQAPEDAKPQRVPRESRRNRVAGGKSGEPLHVDIAAAQGAAVTTTARPVAPPSESNGPQAPAATNVSDNLPQGVARMTFSSGKQTQSGFTPEKDGAQSRTEPDLSSVQAVKRDLSAFSDASDVKAVSTVSQETADTSAAKATVSAAAAETVTENDVQPQLQLLQTPKKEAFSTPSSSTSLPRVASKSKMEKLDVKKEYERRKLNQAKDGINLVVIGHVDAGKSTLMGHVLYQLGFVNKRLMHKYEQESKKLGKASFAYAWVLDETEEERTRGVTMDVAQTRFETATKVVTLLDAPGHKDFIPNMITGAAQADVAVLVVNATRGEFETGFEAGGQTREHAMLIRSLGVSQLLVAINKMDTVEWSEDRYRDILKKLGAFLKQAGFRESDVAYIPCSGLSGENLTKAPTESQLLNWYKGPSLTDQIDQFIAPERAIDKPLRMCVSDVFKGMGAGFSVSGTVQSGSVQVGERLLVMPQGEMATVRGIQMDELPSQFAFAGDNISLTITGIEMNNIGIGSIMCNPSWPVRSSSRFQARVVVFNTDTPITKGFPVVLHYQSSSEPGHIKKLISQLHKNTGEVVKKKPRCLTKNSSAVIEVELNRPVCLELYKDFKDLGRFMLRHSGSTLAAGVVTEILDMKAAKFAE